MKVKGFPWAGLATDDFQRSLRFFTEVFGPPVDVQSDDVAILTVGHVGSWDRFQWQYFRSPDGHIFEIKTISR